LRSEALTAANGGGSGDYVSHFPGLTVPQKCIGDWAILHRIPLKEHTAFPLAGFEGRGHFTTEKEKRKQM